MTNNNLIDDGQKTVFSKSQLRLPVPAVSHLFWVKPPGMASFIKIISHGNKNNELRIEVKLIEIVRGLV